MKKLTDDLKRILTGLAYQDASEYLSMQDKLTTLGVIPQRAQKSSAPHVKAYKRIAVISSGRKTLTALNYALQTCQRLGAQLDLLVRSPEDTAVLAAAEQRSMDQGINYQHIFLPDNAAQGLLDYIRSRLSLIYIVALPNDPMIRQLVEVILPAKNMRLPVPLVLIADDSVTTPRASTSAM